jgi:hypothetical protein
MEQFSLQQTSVESSFRQLSLFGIPDIILQKKPHYQSKDVLQHKRESAQLTLIPNVTIHPSSINLWNEVHWHPYKPGRFDETTGEDTKQVKFEHLLNSKRSAEGKVSKIAQRKISKAIDYMIEVTPEKKIQNRVTGKIMKMKVSFLTLTLPSTQIHSDNEIKEKCLNSFLIEVKKIYKVNYYLWRAEKQENGNLHFHLLIDKYIDYQQLRDRWNRIINKLDYVDNYRNEQLKWHNQGFKVRTELLKSWPEYKQKQAYERGSKSHWNSPNSTDIHKLNEQKNIKAYVSKYISKSEWEANHPNEPMPDNIKVEGRIWGCSQNLSNIKGAISNVDNALENEIRILKESSEVRIYKENYFQVIYFPPGMLSRLNLNKLNSIYQSYLATTFNFNSQLQLTG